MYHRCTIGARTSPNAKRVSDSPDVPDALDEPYANNLNDQICASFKTAPLKSKLDPSFLIR